MELSSSKLIIPLMNFLVIFSLCSSYYIIRSMGLTLAKMINDFNTEFSIYKFVNDNNNDISQIAQNNVIYSFTNLIVIPELPSLDFQTVANSQNVYLFQFYIASFAKKMVQKYNEFHLKELQRLILKMYEYFSLEQRDSVQLLSLLIFVNNSSINCSQNDILELKTFTKRFINAATAIEELKPASYGALLSNIDFSLMESLFISNSNECLSLYMTSFAIRVYTLSNIFNVSNIDLPKLIEAVLSLLNSLIDLIFSTEVISREIEFKCQESKILTTPRLLTIINNILLSISHVFYLLYELKKKWSKGPFPRVPTCNIKRFPNFNSEKC